jgi:hypothetical protein
MAGFSKKKLLNIKCVLIFSTAFAYKVPLSRKNSTRYYHKRPYVFKQSARYSCQILTKLEFSRQIFEKYPNIKSTKIRPVETDLFHAGRQADGQK